MNHSDHPLPPTQDPRDHAPAPRKHRKLNRSAHQLKRNAACLPCRRRRIKCDGAKPQCGSCVRSIAFLQRTNPDEERDRKGVQCFYEDEEGESEGPPPAPTVNGQFMGQRIEDPRNTVRKLEARVGASLQSCHIQYAIGEVESADEQRNSRKRWVPVPRIMTTNISITMDRPFTRSLIKDHQPSPRSLRMYLYRYHPTRRQWAYRKAQARRGIP